jgi:hypothetical protein
MLGSERNTPASKSPVFEMVFTMRKSAFAYTLTATHATASIPTHSRTFGPKHEPRTHRSRQHDYLPPTHHHGCCELPKLRQRPGPHSTATAKGTENKRQCTAPSSCARANCVRMPCRRLLVLHQHTGCPDVERVHARTANGVSCAAVPLDTAPPHDAQTPEYTRTQGCRCQLGAAPEWRTCEHGPHTPWKEKAHSASMRQPAARSSLQRSPSL